MCIDYRDLNKASPNDDFSFPHFDVLVENNVEHAQFSFMDGSSGHNQIRMAPENRANISFTTPWSIFCHKMMSFGLNTAGATYQIAMTTLFHDMMHKDMEVYVDDMIAKSRVEENHLAELQKIFKRLQKNDLKLNMNKCTFGATSGNL